MRIIPAIDILDGKCVRLSKGDYATQKIYNENPVEVAKEFENHGIQYVHVVDLDGARSKSIVNYKTLAAIAGGTNLKIDFGGGIKSDEDIRIAFESGAQQVTAGSIAVRNPVLFASWLETYGPDRIILGADCNRRMIATQGWLEASGFEVVEFVRSYVEQGVREVICTDIQKDGMLEGPSVELYTELLAACPVNLIASGGVTSMEDLHTLKSIGCVGAIIGKAIYEGTLTMEALAGLC